MKRVIESKIRPQVIRLMDSYTANSIYLSLNDQRKIIGYQPFGRPICINVLHKDGVLLRENTMVLDVIDLKEITYQIVSMVEVNGNKNEEIYFHYHSDNKENIRSAIIKLDWLDETFFIEHEKILIKSPSDKFLSHSIAEAIISMSGITEEGR